MMAMGGVRLAIRKHMNYSFEGSDATGAVLCIKRLLCFTSKIALGITLNWPRGRVLLNLRTEFGNEYCN